MAHDFPNGGSGKLPAATGALFEQPRSLNCGRLLNRPCGRRVFRPVAPPSRQAHRAAAAIGGSGCSSSGGVRGLGCTGKVLEAREVRTASGLLEVTAVSRPVGRLRDRDPPSSLLHRSCVRWLPARSSARASHRQTCARSWFLNAGPSSLVRALGEYTQSRGLPVFWGYCPLLTLVCPCCYRYYRPQEIVTVPTLRTLCNRNRTWKVSKTACGILVVTIL